MIKKTKKLVKKALTHPELFSFGELSYFKLWLTERKKRKEEKRKAKENKS